MTRLSRERADAATLAMAVLVVPLTWWLLLGWSWPRSLAGHDAIAQELLIIREVAEGGGWSSLVFRPDLLGGFKGQGVLGPFPLYALLGGFGLSPVAIAVVSALTVQALLAFLACRAAEDVAVGWSDDPTAPGRLERLGILWLCAFAPVLAWRVSYGHMNLVVGLLPFAAALAVTAAAAVRTVSVTLLGLAALAFALGLLHSGQQMVVCGVIFGAPILLGAWISLGGPWRRLGPPLLTAAGALLVVLPAYWGMLAHARSSDASRGLGAAAVIYDYVTATAADWLTSIPWTVASLPAGREAPLHHEINYPVGPVLLLLAAVPWGRARALGVGLALTLAAVLVVSMDIAPASRALLALLPPLKSFRVPERSVLPWVWAVAVVGTAAIVHSATSVRAVRRTETPRAMRRRTRPRRQGQATTTVPWRPPAVIVALPLALALWLIPSVAREVGVWLVAAAGIALLRWRREPPLVAAVLLVVLGVGSVAAFRERLLPFPDARALLAEAGRLGDTVRGAKPELGSPLTRVRLELTIPAFATNTAFAAGLSSLDGYAVPTRRFAALLFAVRGERYQPTAVFFDLRPRDRAFAVLRQLYDVAWHVTIPSRGQLAVQSLGETAGPGWFSASVVRVADLPALAQELREAGERLHQRAHEALWLDGADPLAAGATLPATVDRRCRDARVVEVQAVSRGRQVVARTETAAECPLTFAMNFTEDLRATATLADGRRLRAAVFPGYGALASVIAPAGTAEVRVDAELPALPGAPAVILLGLASCAAAVYLAWRPGVGSSSLAER